MAAIHTGAAPRLFETLRGLLNTWVGLLRTRVEIISTELEEERERLEEIVLLAVAMAFCVSLGVLLLTLFVVILFWETYRLQVLVGFALLYLALGLAAALKMRQKVRAKPKLFSTTLAELAKDQAHLSSRS
ncbi:MAG: phage holin family protein [Verrucomicrobiota bacterium]|jgi:uncharacterized membrane protein YqjE